MGVSEHYSLDTRTESWFEAILFPMHVFLCISNSKNPLFYSIRYDTVRRIGDSDHFPVAGAVLLRMGPSAQKCPIPKMVPIRSSPHNQLIPAVDSETALSNISRCLFFRFLVNSRGKLRPISESDVSTLLQYFAFSQIRSNTVLLREGDTSNASLVVLVRGSIQCVNEAYEIGVLQKGDWLGGEAILQEACYYSAIALTDCVALTLSDHALKQMQATAPLLAMSLKRLLKGQSITALLSILDGLISDFDQNAVSTFPRFVRRRSLCSAHSSKPCVRTAGKCWLRLEPIWRQRST